MEAVRVTQGALSLKHAFSLTDRKQKGNLRRVKESKRELDGSASRWLYLGNRAKKKVVNKGIYI